MKLLSIELARVIFFMNVKDINPKGRLMYVELAHLAEQYGFTKYPTYEQVATVTGELKFENGHFVNEEGIPVYVNISIYPEGIICDTRSSTKDSEFFLAYILNHLSDELNLPRYEAYLKKIGYHSQFYFTTETSLDFINPKLKEISKYLSETVEDGMHEFEVGGISLWPDQTHKINPPTFTFERQAGAPFAENRYFSGAPLQTDKHISLIEQMERILSK